MDREIIIVALEACARLLPRNSLYLPRVMAERDAQLIQAHADSQAAYRPKPAAPMGTNLDIRA